MRHGRDIAIIPGQVVVVGVRVRVRLVRVIAHQRGADGREGGGGGRCRGRRRRIDRIHRRIMHRELRPGVVGTGELRRSEFFTHCFFSDAVGSTGAFTQTVTLKSEECPFGD